MLPCHDASSNILIYFAIFDDIMYVLEVNIGAYDNIVCFDFNTVTW